MKYEARVGPFVHAAPGGPRRRHVREVIDLSSLFSPSLQLLPATKQWIHSYDSHDACLLTINWNRLSIVLGLARTELSRKFPTTKPARAHMKKASSV